MTPERPEVPDAILGALRSACLRLPEVIEEAAWVGLRWRIRRHTFAHVLAIDARWPPAYAQAAGSDGPLTVMTFRSSSPELETLGGAGRPYFRPVWFPDILGIVLGRDTDWSEVAELVTESYCLLAPRKLVALVDRPDAT